MRKVIVVALGSLTLVSLAAGGLLAGCTEDTTVSSIDAGKDSTVSETGTEAGPTDGGSDVFTTDAPIPTIDSFRNQMADEICNFYAGCCSTTDAAVPADAGIFSRAFCLNSFTGNGFDTSITGLPPNPVDATKYTFDQIKGQECLGRIQQLKCGSNSAADYKATRDACFAAVTGKAAAGATCGASIDCAPGNYCDQTTKKCVATKAEGADCDPGTYANDECSYRSSGAGCNATTKKCTALIATGQACYPTGNGYNASCQSGLCDPTTILCATSAPFVYPAGNYPDGAPSSGPYTGSCQDLSTPDGG